MNQIVDDATPSIVINFKSRKEAEVALVKGRTFQDRLLSITWVSGHHLHRGGAGTNSNASIQLSSRSEQTAPIADEDIDLEVIIRDYIIPILIIIIIICLNRDK